MLSISGYHAIYQQTHQCNGLNPFRSSAGAENAQLTLQDVRHSRHVSGYVKLYPLTQHVSVKQHFQCSISIFFHFP